jgi:hypothetical protein
MQSKFDTHVTVRNAGTLTRFDATDIRARGRRTYHWSYDNYSSIVRVYDASSLQAPGTSDVFCFPTEGI